MGIYSGFGMSDYKSIYPDTLDSIMEDNNIDPSESEDIVEAGYDIVQNIHENYSTIMQHIGISELASLEQTGEEMVYTEGVLSSIYNAIKNFLKKIWEKIKSLFKRFMMIIDSYTKNDKEFLNKYRSQILSVSDLSDFTFKGYKWSAKAFGSTESVLKELSIGSREFRLNTDTIAHKQELESMDGDKFDENIEVIRGSIIAGLGGSGGKYSESEFSKELKEVYRSGQSEKEELDSKDISVHAIISDLSGSKEIKKGVETAFKASKKSIEEDDKYVDRLLRDHTKNGVPGDDKTVPDIGNDNYKTYNELDTDTDKSGYASRQAEAIKTKYTTTKNGKTVFNTKGADNEVKNAKIGKIDKNSKTTGKEMSERKTMQYGLTLRTIKAFKDLLIKVDTAYLAAWKDRSRQNKAIAIKIVAHKPKKESAYIESYNGDNFLSNIILK